MSMQSVGSDCIRGIVNTILVKRDRDIYIQILCTRTWLALLSLPLSALTEQHQLIQPDDLVAEVDVRLRVVLG